jgi:hypothetical protein
MYHPISIIMNHSLTCWNAIDKPIGEPKSTISLKQGFPLGPIPLGCPVPALG